MPWLETDVREQRMQFVVEALQPGVNLSALCRRRGISRKTGYKWLQRYRAAGSLVGLEEYSRRPHASPTRTSPAVTARVVALRRQYGWAGRKLRSLLLAGDGIDLAVATIDRIIRREGLVDPDDAHRPAVRRFERAAPNELWQMDFKGPYPLRPPAWCFPLSVLDDHSRFAVGLTALAGTDGGPVSRQLVRCFQTYGVPAALLIDHGTPWWGAANGHGLTHVAVALIRQGIELIYSGVHHPQTQGKVERFHRTLARRLRQWGVPTTVPGFREALARFRTEYNDVRPHEALGDAPPATRYTPSARRYQPRPRPWDYPPGTPVKRVDRTGSVALGGRRYFVCQALRGEWVGTQSYDDRLLVSYRHMYVRDIDLVTGKTVPLLGRVGDDVLPMS